MATTEYKLEMVFADADEENFKHTLKYVDPEVTSANVKNLMNAMITNGTIYDKPPVTKVSAQIIETQKTSININ